MSTTKKRKKNTNTFICFVCNELKPPKSFTSQQRDVKYPKCKICISIQRKNTKSSKQLKILSCYGVCQQDKGRNAFNPSQRSLDTPICRSCYKITCHGICGKTKTEHNFSSRQIIYDSPICKDCYIRMNVTMITCTGKCKTEKRECDFHPLQRGSDTPICRACYGLFCIVCRNWTEHIKFTKYERKLNCGKICSDCHNSQNWPCIKCRLSKIPINFSEDQRTRRIRLCDKCRELSVCSVCKIKQGVDEFEESGTTCNSCLRTLCCQYCKRHKRLTLYDQYQRVNDEPVCKTCYNKILCSGCEKRLKRKFFTPEELIKDNSYCINCNKVFKNL